MLIVSSTTVPPIPDSNFALGEIAVEAFTCLLLFKNLFSFGLTWDAFNWLRDGGIEKIFNIIGSVQIVICLLSIPMCKFGNSSVSEASSN